MASPHQPKRIRPQVPGLPDNLEIPVYHLDMEWRAIHKDGTEIKQNVGKPDEHHLGHVNHDQLIAFYIEGQRGTYSINLKTGEFNLNGIKLRFRLRDVPIEDIERHLVYFRRVKHDFHPDERGTVTTVRHCFGWQASFEGQSHNRIVVIEPDGSFTILHRK